MDLSTLYWILILPNIKDAFIAASILMMLGIMVTFIFGFLESEPSAKKWGLSKIKYLIPMVVIAALIPTNKQMMYMIGGYAATNVENIEKLPKNVVNAANKFLETYTEQKESKGK